MALTLGHTQKRNSRDSTAVFELQLKGEGRAGANDESLFVEFTRHELLDFFERLDEIQRQMDTLSQ